MVADYKLSFKTENDNFIKEINRLSNERLKEYEEKVKAHKIMLKQLSDVKGEIIDNRKKLHDLTNKVEHEQEILQSEGSRLETIDNECRLLEMEETKLKNTMNDTKRELNRTLEEKKRSIKKIKKEIKAFKTGVNIYERYLQLSMNISNEGLNAVIITVTIRNLRKATNYNVILKETDKHFELIEITPHSQSSVKAALLYNQNKDIQGLLAFLYKMED